MDTSCLERDFDKATSNAEVLPGLETVSETVSETLNQDEGVEPWAIAQTFAHSAGIHPIPKTSQIMLRKCL